VLEVDDFLAAVGSMDDGPVRVEVGNAVRGSDYLEIGRVKEVVDATASHEAYMLVPRGKLFETDTFIPLDAVTKRAGDVVFVNVPRIVMRKMPWGHPPTRLERAERLGPPARDVINLYGVHAPTAHDEPPPPTAGTPDAANIHDA